MAISFHAAGTPGGGSSITEIILTTPTASVGDLLVVAYGFEGVSSAGPWIDPNVGQYSTTYIGPFTDWKRICYQGPSASGCGLEVWAALYGSGSNIGAKFLSSSSAEAVSGSWSGAYDSGGHDIITDGTVRAGTTAQATGDNPAAPSIYAFVNELLIVAAADLLGSPGYSPPSGFTERADSARSGFGTVEVTLADKPVTTEGDSGSLPFTATASPAGSKGSTATLAVRPTVPGPTSPLVAVTYSLT